MLLLTWFRHGAGYAKELVKSRTLSGIFAARTLAGRTRLCRNRTSFVEWLTHTTHNR